MENYDYYFDIAYKKALHLTNDVYASENIALEVTYLLILKQNTIPKERIIPWLINTTKNRCKRVFFANTKENEFKQKIKSIQEYENNIALDTDIGNNKEVNFFYKSYIETLKQFTEEEKSIINVFLQNHMDVAKTAMILERPYSEIQKKIYRLKGEIRAKGYLNFGYIGTKKIITPYLNDAILRFFKDLKLAIANESYKTLNHYFSDININDFSFNLDIKKLIDYDVRLKNSIYTVTIIFINNDKKSESMIIQFKLSPKKRIKMIALPKKAPLYKFSVKSKEGQELKKILAHYKEDKRGLQPLPNKLLEKYIEKYKKQHKNEKINED